MALLARDPRHKVVGDAADAGQAQRRAQELQPDLILLDNHWAVSMAWTPCPLCAKPRPMPAS